MPAPDPTSEPTTEPTTEPTADTREFARLQIEGMHCAACVSRLEKIMGRQTGVISATVNLATESALIEHTADWQLPSILSAIQKAGFEAHFTPDPAAVETVNCASGDATNATQTVTSPRAASVAAGSDTDALGTSSSAVPGRADASFLPVALALASAGILMLPMLTGLPEWPAWLQFVLCTPVQFVSGAVFLRGAWGAVRIGQANMDVLVSLGSLSAWVWSTWLWLKTMTLSGSDHLTAHAVGHLFYEASASVIAFVLLGKWLEKRTRQKTAQAITGLAQLRPDTVERLSPVPPTHAVADTNGTTDAAAQKPPAEDALQADTIPLALVRMGDVLRIQPASRIPCDGVLQSGHSHVDESALTGESIPRNCSPGDILRAGTLNMDGVLQMRVTALGEKTMLGQVIHLIELSQGRKLPIQALADRIAAVFVPVVLLIAAATALALALTGADIETILMRAVTVLVIACPCALGLATPAAIIAGTGAAARAGLLIRDPRALHLARSIDTIVFDKTGTLTAGHPELTHILLQHGQTQQDQTQRDPTQQDSALQIAASLQAGKSHPLGLALVQAASQRGLAHIPLSDIKLLPGIGMRGHLTATASEWLMCNPRHAALLLTDLQAGLLQALLQTPLAAAGTVSVLLGSSSPQDQQSQQNPQKVQNPQAPENWTLHAVFVFVDTARPQAVPVLAALKAQGMRLVLLSGDRQAAVDALAGELPLDEAIGECSPADKATRIRELQQLGHHVAMVGDGVNDAPAMAQADLALAMGGGTDIAAQTAHITLMNNQLHGVAGALDIARRIHRNIAENLFWAFAYNTVCIPLAALGWFNPMLAAAAMALSSVSVVLNALRLSRKTEMTT